MQARIRPNACRVEIQDIKGVQHRILIFEDGGSNVSIGPVTPEGWEQFLTGLNDPADADERERAKARTRILSPPPPGLKLN